MMMLRIFTLTIAVGIVSAASNAKKKRKNPFNNKLVNNALKSSPCARESAFQYFQQQINSAGKNQMIRTAHQNSADLGNRTAFEKARDMFNKEKPKKKSNFREYSLPNNMGGLLNALPARNVDELARKRKAAPKASIGNFVKEIQLRHRALVLAKMQEHETLLKADHARIPIRIRRGTKHYYAGQSGILYGYHAQSGYMVKLSASGKPTRVQVKDIEFELALKVKTKKGLTIYMPDGKDKNGKHLDGERVAGHSFASGDHFSIMATVIFNGKKRRYELAGAWKGFWVEIKNWSTDVQKTN